MNLKLITKKNCGKCENVKANIPQGIEIQILDGEEPEGMTEMAMHGLFEKHVPLLIVDDKEVVEGALNIKKKIQEAAQC